MVERACTPDLDDAHSTVVAPRRGRLNNATSSRDGGRPCATPRRSASGPCARRRRAARRAGGRDARGEALLQRSPSVAPRRCEVDGGTARCNRNVSSRSDQRCRRSWRRPPRAEGAARHPLVGGGGGAHRPLERAGAVALGAFDAGHPMRGKRSPPASTWRRKIGTDPPVACRVADDRRLPNASIRTRERPPRVVPGRLANSRVARARCAMRSALARRAWRGALREHLVATGTATRRPRASAARSRGAARARTYSAEARSRRAHLREGAITARTLPAALRTESRPDRRLRRRRDVRRALATPCAASRAATADALEARAARGRAARARALVKGAEPDASTSCYADDAAPGVQLGRARCAQPPRGDRATAEARSPSAAPRSLERRVAQRRKRFTWASSRAIVERGGGRPPPADGASRCSRRTLAGAGRRTLPDGSEIATWAR